MTSEKPAQRVVWDVYGGDRPVYHWLKSVASFLIVYFSVVHKTFHRDPVHGLVKVTGICGKHCGTQCPRHI